MNYVQIPASTLSAIANAVAEAGARAFTVDPAQLKLSLGDDQACEHFMAERDELREEIAGLRYQNSTLRRINADMAASLNAELDGRETYQAGVRVVQDQLQNAQQQLATQEAVLAHIADFGQQLQASLNTVGISYVAGENGEPHITVNTDVLMAAIEQSQDSAAD